MQPIRTHIPPSRRPLALAVAGALALPLLAACGGSGATTTTTTKAPTAVAPDPNGVVTAPHTARAAEAVYNPNIDPANFTTRIINPYFTLAPGMVRITKGTKDGVPQTHTTVVTSGTKVIAGVRTVVVRDKVTTNGALSELVTDWYAQDKRGNVWYFGESTADYEKGVVTTTKGSWLTGVDGAKPGIVMPANPVPGPSFYSEFRPGVAEDKGQVLRTGIKLTVPYGSYTGVVLIRDTNPLDPQLISHKWYAKGVGLLKTVRVGSSHQEHAELVALKGV